MSRMANDLTWIKFHFKDWSSDEGVQDMTCEQVGAFWRLLGRQFEEGSIPKDDFPRLAHIIGPRVALPTEDEVEYFKTRIWDYCAGVNFFGLSSKFKEDPEQPGRLYNPKLREAILEGRRYREAKSKGGEKSQQTRAKQQAEAAKNLEPVLDEAGVVLDYDFLWKEYPKNKRNPRFGYYEGMEQVRNTITDRDSYDSLLAAIRNYAREVSRPGYDRTKVKSFSNFMRCWSEWVPEDFLRLRKLRQQGQPAPVLEQPTAVEPAKPKMRVLANGESPPWEIIRNPTESDKQLIEKHWPQEKRDAWLRGEI